MSPERSDGELLAAAAAGDGAAFAAFYRRHLPAVVGFLLRQTGNREVCADLAAEVFAAVFLSARRYRPGREDSAWPWLRGIAHSGGFTSSSARELVTQLRPGALPVQLLLVSVHTAR